MRGVREHFYIRWGLALLDPSHPLLGFGRLLLSELEKLFQQWFGLRVAGLIEIQKPQIIGRVRSLLVVIGQFQSRLQLRFRLVELG